MIQFESDTKGFTSYNHTHQVPAFDEFYYESEWKVLFPDGSAIIGKNLIEFLSWARKSFEWTKDQNRPDDGVLALPPIQRNAAWNPRQVVDVWDSVLRGLPLGAFMLQSRDAGILARGAGADARNENLGKGWDLLDGQQRTRSLLLGLFGPDLRKGKQDRRCLWINLDGAPDRYLFDLQLTSASQPFGYDVNGYKLNSAIRGNARARFEPPSEIEPNKPSEIRSGERLAYSHELFGGFFEGSPHLCRVEADQTFPIPPVGYPEHWPPLPHGIALESLTHDRAIFPLHVILQACIDATDTREALSRLGLRDHHRLEDLAHSLRCFKEAAIALVSATSVPLHNLPLLYDRIGAGGTPLSNEERLFSFYKFCRPLFHDIVRDIYDNPDTGRVMAPSKIAASAIRIANTVAHSRRHPEQTNRNNYLPDIATFAEACRDQGAVQDKAGLLYCLDELVGVTHDGKETERRFSNIFIALFKALAYNEALNPLGFPKVLFWRLPANLVHVLLFWLLQPENKFDNSENHLSRFVIFWLLCSRNDDKASYLCFRLIREDRQVSLRNLYLKMSSDVSLSRNLITPALMNKILIDRSTPPWRSISERIGTNHDPIVAEFVTRWWRDAGNFLPWLQRSYIDTAFREYDPTADREDDTPYDVDHMVPRADWLRAANPELPGRFTAEQRARLRWLRYDIGDSIGNKWLVDFSINRGWSDVGFEAKLNSVQEDAVQNPVNIRLGRLIDVFDASTRDTWDIASPSNWHAISWSDERMDKFQLAVEERAAWLYNKLYTDLGFDDWKESPA